VAAGICGAPHFNGEVKKLTAQIETFIFIYKFFILFFIFKKSCIFAARFKKVIGNTDGCQAMI
jgi:hypothetical protein